MLNTWIWIENLVDLDTWSSIPFSSESRKSKRTLHIENLPRLVKRFGLVQLRMSLQYINFNPCFSFEFLDLVGGLLQLLHLKLIRLV